MNKKVVAISIAIVAIVAIAIILILGNKTEEKNRKVLRVGMECAYAPYNWLQTNDSNGAVPIKDGINYAYGYDVMMAKKIAEELDCDLEIYQIDWDSLPLALESNKIDCVIAGQSITSERLERLETVDFTTPYYYASIVTLTNSDSKYTNAKGVSDLEGATCTSQINTCWYDTCLPQIKNANILPAMDTAPNMLVALNSKTVDLVVTDMPTAMAAIQVYPNMKILDFTNNNNNFEISDEEINIGISVKKGNSELLEKINNVLKKYNAQDYEKMMNEAIKVQPLSK